MRVLSSAPAAWSVLELSAGLVRAAFTSLPPWPPTAEAGACSEQRIQSEGCPPFSISHCPLPPKTGFLPEGCREDEQPLCAKPARGQRPDPSFLALEGALGSLGWQEVQCPAQGGLGVSRVVSAHTRTSLSLIDVGQSPLLSSPRSGFDQDPRHRHQAGPITETDVTQMGVYMSLELPTASSEVDSRT